VLPSDRQIPGGRIEAPVAEQELNGPQVHPGFQQMRGKAMATLIVTLLITRRWPRSGPGTIPSSDKR
jgi:hypothetical protein